MIIGWASRPALAVVLAAGGYPESYAKGKIISGLPSSGSTDSKIFHAGTEYIEGRIVTAGGRVLCACSLGHSIADAQTKAYALTKQIRWDGVYFRSDIGYRAVRREAGH